MRRWSIRAGLLAVVATLVGLPGAAPAFADTSTPAAPSASSVPATSSGSASAASTSTAGRLAKLNSCLVAQKAGDVLILLDKSGSIHDTDPTGARIAAANALLDRLARRVEDPDSEIHGAKLTTAVTTFADTVFQGTERVKPADTVWTALNGSTVAGLKDQVNALKPVTNGLETNYWAALDWVTKAEEAHSGAAVASGCHLVFWFSDGADLISPDRTVSGGFPDGPTMTTPWTKTGTTDVHTLAEALAVQGASEKDMQRPGGLADRLRADNIVMVGLGLSLPGANAQPLNLMKCIVENDVTDDKTNASCGALPAIGAFYLVNKADDLLLEVDTLGDSATPLSPDAAKPVCARTACTSNHTFDLDSALRKVHVVGVPSSTDPKVALTSSPTVVIKSPSGATATLNPPSGAAGGPPATARIGSIELSYQWVTGNQITVDMVRPSDNDNWTGTWSVTFIDTTSDNPNAVARIRVSLSADLALTPQSPPTTAQIGEAFSLITKLTSLTGGPALIADPAPSMTATVTLTPTGGTPIEVARGTPDAVKQINWTVPDSVPLGPATVRVSLVVRTTKRDLDPVIREFPVSVIGPKGSPTLDTGATGGKSIDFGSIQGTDAASSSLTVIGPGCVWVTGGALTSHPEGVTDVSIGGQAAAPGLCVSLADGERKTISLTATPATAGNGQVRGQVVVHLARANHQSDPAVPSQNLPYTLDMRRKPAGLVKWLVLAGGLLIGIGLPILVLALTRRIAARYPSDVQLVAARIPVLVKPRALTTSTGAAPEVPGQWNSVPPPTEGRRTLQVEGVSLRAKSGPIWSPMAGYSQAQERPGTGSTTPYYGGPGFAARLPLGVQGSWALLFRSTDDLARPGNEVPGDLLLISHPSTTPQARRSLLNEAQSQGPDLVNSFGRQSARSSDRPAPIRGTDRGAWSRRRELERWRSGPARWPGRVRADAGLEWSGARPAEYAGRTEWADRGAWLGCSSARGPWAQPSGATPSWGGGPAGPAQPGGNGPTGPPPPTQAIPVPPDPAPGRQQAWGQTNPDEATPPPPGWGSTPPPQGWGSTPPPQGWGQ